MITPSLFKPFTDGYHETAQQVPDWVLNRARDHFTADAARKAQITDRARFAAYRDACRQRYRDIVGPLAEATASPAAETTGILEREGYNIQKLIFKGRSGLSVTANAYFPAPPPEMPAPGVLMVCGHSAEGKAAPKYQQVCIDLVRAGFIVLIMDSLSHGEMVQCLDPRSGAAPGGTNGREHSYLQLAASVLNRNIMREFINNARGGLDLLASLPGVDTARLAVTGNSGGGHLTQALMMTDDRVRVALSGCSQTTREKYLENGVRAYDGEQNYYGCIPTGLDYDDFFAAFAPRPVRIGAAAHDYYAIEGVLEMFERARRCYRLFDAEDKIDICIADEPHGYSAPLRRGCVEWFTRHLLDKTVTPCHADAPVETPETLQCTRSGQIMLDYPDTPSALDLLREEWRTVRRRAAAKPPLTRRELCRRLALPAAVEAPAHVRRTACHVEAGMTAERIFFFSEPGMIVTGVVYTPAGPVTQTVLLLIPDGTQGQTPYLDRIRERLTGGHQVMVFDPRGTGAVRMRQRNAATGLAFKSTEFRVANDHFMLGTSIAARRAYDALRAAAWLRGRAGGAQPSLVQIEAHGWPAIYGLLAAAAGDGVTAGPMTGLPDSWEAVFAKESRDPDRFSEPLVVPALRGDIDLADLRRMAGETRPTT